MAKVFETIIIGAGPCGMRVALELKKKDVDFLLLDPGTPGGKVNVAPRVDNYPGQHEIPGPDLAVIFFERLMKEGVEFIGDEIISLDKKDGVFELVGRNATYYCRAVYIATGTVERKIGLPLEDELFGHGISYCALCDGHFFKGQDVLVIGGGNTALKEAIYMADLAKHLFVIHRRNQFRGSLKLVEELKSFENVEILTPYIPIEFIKDEDHLVGVKIQNRETNEERVLSVQGAFPLVGQNPNSKFIKLDIMDERGNIPVDKKMMTRVEGAFSGGDILPRDIRQIYLAEHDGMVAVNSIMEYLGK